MPKRSEEHMEARRAQILAAAKTCFSRWGIAGTTIRKICAEAGLSTGMAHLHFSSKEDIVEAMVEEALQADLKTAAPAKEDWGIWDVLTHFDEEFFLKDMLGPYGEEKNRLEMFLNIEALQNPKIKKILGSHKEKLGGLFCDFIKKAQKRGEVNQELSPESLVDVMFGLYLGLQTMISVYPEVDGKKYVETMGAVFSGALPGPKPWGKTKT